MYIYIYIYTCSSHRLAAVLGLRDAGGGVVRVVAIET